VTQRRVLDGKRGANVEGVNIGGILLGYLGILVLACAGLVALVLLVARKATAARFLLAAGMLLATIIVAVAALTFLKREYHPDDTGAALIVLAALTLFLAGVGQFAAAFRSPSLYGAALGFAAGSILYGATSGLAGSDVLPWRLPEGPRVSLLLAAASLMLAVLPTRRTAVALLWTAQALLGAIAGLAVGAACVTTHSFPLPDEGRGTPVMVEVYLLGVRVSEETRSVLIPAEGVSAIRSLSFAQDAWLNGVPAAGAVVGLIAAWAIAAGLVKRSGAEVAAKPLAVVDPLHEYGSSSEQIKPA
jgi:hypothetical protein